MVFKSDPGEYDRSERPPLVAYWAWDEMKGIVAHDSSGNNDANIVGEPVWQPTGGIVDGAPEIE